MISGLCQHFLISFRLNHKSGRSVAYGYLMPVIFLIGFGSIFQSGEPRLMGQMGQILTITILGGACLGMPTSLVAERERGLWRRFQLLPLPTNILLISVFGVRVVIVGLGVALQIILARLIYGTPFPTHPLVFAIVYLAVIFAFLGIGLIITALATDVPSVQALGQCLFLPMILIGGVGVPLMVLPEWAQVVASFMPGRYAVEAIQLCYSEGPVNVGQLAFSILALSGIGATAMLSGFQLIQWESSRAVTRKTGTWLAFSVMTWIVIGISALSTERVHTLTGQGSSDVAAITLAQIDAIRYGTLPEDDGFYTPLAPPLDGRRLTHRMEEFQPLLQKWKPGLIEDQGQAVRNLLCVASIADIAQDDSENLIARMVFDQMKQRIPPEDLKKSLAWIIMNPDRGRVITRASELGLSHEVDSGIVRQRCNWYALKFLGRLTGKIPENK